ncbi:cytosolic regulator pianissimo [Anaeramoeba flamelloides]|uniref:Cytosolic regulator pianissimo n=1 Tax=Anaeramoeba flamelloides TaxID=1746091 RepID=A0ABQ8YK74_9EUKA|nr:cytosolic regulator pianissimo [Anaeramoeba flamelloides]
MNRNSRSFTHSEKFKTLSLFYPLSNKEIPIEKKIEILNLIATSINIFQDLLVNDKEIRFQIYKTLRHLLQNENSIIRTLSCRVLRKCMQSSSMLVHIETLHLHFFLIRCLEQRSEYGLERVEALKFIYHLIQLDCNQIPRSFVLSLVAISENENDPMRISCLLALCEIAIKSPKIVSVCGGISLICKMCIDPKLVKIQPVLLRCLLNLLNCQKKKRYLSESDLKIILSPFISLFELKYTEHRFLQFKSSKNAIEILLRDWAGLIFLSNNSNGLKAFLTTLKLPSRKAKIFAIEMLYKLFFLKMPKTKKKKQVFTENYPNMKMKNNKKTKPKNIWGNIDLIFPLEHSPRHNLIDNYLAILLVSFMDVGLFQALVEIGKGDDKIISFYVAHFLSEILHKSRYILSLRLCTILQSLPSLFEVAATFSHNKYNRIRASKLLSELDRFARKKKKKNLTQNDFHINLIVSRMKEYRTEEEETFESTSKQIIEEMKSRKDKSLIDQEFENKIKECKVLSTDDYLKWNFQLIKDLLIVTKNNKKYFDSCIKNKFYKNLLNFFDPKNQQFCNIGRNKPNLIHVEIGVKLIELLLNINNDGFEILKTSNFLISLNEALRIENEGTSSAKSGMKRLFTPTRMSKTLTKEYFTLIGTLSTNKFGLDLLISTNIFKFLQQIVETKGRGDLALPIILSLDYNNSDITRMLLGKVLHSGSKLSKLQTIEHLKLLWRAGVNDFSEWAVTMLVYQLNDKDQDIVSAALDLIDECCSRSSRNFDNLVSCKPPDLEKFGVKGKNLLICVLSTENGLQYLKKIGYLEKQFIYWESKGCIDYVKDLEHYLTAIFNIDSSSSNNYNNNININNFDNNNNQEVYLPPHFFGELVKTKQGIEILDKRKLIPKWFSVLNYFLEKKIQINLISKENEKTKKLSNCNKNYDEETVGVKGSGGCEGNGNTEDEEKKIIIDPIEIRAILWTIGNISTSNLGYSLIKKYNPVQLISRIANNTSTLSIRGTCLYVLGLMASTPLGRKKLKRFDWEFPEKGGRMIVTPKKNQKKMFFTFPSVKYLGSFAKNNKKNITLNFIGTNLEKDIFTNISDLSNKITAETATKNLLKYKSENANLFIEKPYLFYRTYKMLEYYRFDCNSRKLIHHLFQNIYFEENIIDNFSTNGFFLKKYYNNKYNNSNRNTNNDSKEIGKSLNNQVDLSYLFENDGNNSNNNNSGSNKNDEGNNDNTNNNNNLKQRQTHKITYSLERLRTIPRPQDVNSRNILEFVSEEDFLKAFGVNRDDFFQLSKMQQMRKRLEWGLN